MQSCPGLEQYAIKKFAEAFEALPRALAENSGVKGSELISKLYAAHHEGNKNMGFDIEVREHRNTFMTFLRCDMRTCCLESPAHIGPSHQFK